MSALSPSIAAPPDSTAFRDAAIILGALTIVRLIALHFSVVDLFFDESQYWSWSRDLAVGYFSKPPLLAWLIAASEHVCGSSEACVRAPSTVLQFGTGLVGFAIGRTLYGTRTGFWTVVVIAFSTGAIYSARIISTDAPLIFFWAVAQLAHAQLRREATWSWASWSWAIVLGIAVGAGLLAKYAMIYFLAGIVLAALIDKPSRALLGKPHLLVAFAAAVVTVLPNLLWNVANGFLTLRHAGNAVVGENIVPSLTRPLEFLGAQFGVFGPVVFGISLAAIARFTSPLLQPADRMLLAFGITPLVVVTATAVFVHAYANWAAAAFVPLAVMATGLMIRLGLRSLLWVSVAIGVVMQALLVVTDAYATRLYLPFTGTYPYHPVLGWKALAVTAGELARAHKTPVIASDIRADVASLLYYWRNQPEQVLAWPTTDLTSFELTRGLTAATPQPILFIAECDGTERMEKFYAKVTPLGGFGMPPSPRYFFAFLLENPRGEIKPIKSCRV
jgi:4-amino-4-deoxy-L-arabinose transferase-like glycosyltransferase